MKYEKRKVVKEKKINMIKVNKIWGTKKVRLSKKHPRGTSVYYYGGCAVLCRDTFSSIGGYYQYNGGILSVL